MKGARVPVPQRSPDAVLGRAVRGLVGPSATDRQSPAVSHRDLRLPTARWARDRGASRIRLVTPARAAGVLGMLASGFLLVFVTGPTAFALSRTDVPDLTWTSQEDLAAMLEVSGGANAFRLDTEPLEAALRTLPAVAEADVSVALPDAALVVRVVEREPVLAWQVGGRRYIADATGAIFATATTRGPLPDGVVVVEDRRLGAGTGLAIGAHLDAVDLDVATRLGSLTPADIGSAASALKVVVTSSDGFVVTAQGAWQAVFGFYSPAARSTDMIPDQVRLLRSLLAAGEGSVRRVILASETGGTYIPRTTPKPSSR